MGWAIETCNLFKSYDRIKAITDLTLTVPEGSVFGLIGPNGAGKSTLIRMLTGIVRPDQGDAFILGRSIKERLEAYDSGWVTSPMYRPCILRFQLLICSVWVAGFMRAGMRRLLRA